MTNKKTEDNRPTREQTVLTNKKRGYNTPATAHCSNSPDTGQPNRSNNQQEDRRQNTTYYRVRILSSKLNEELSTTVALLTSEILRLATPHGKEKISPVLLNGWGDAVRVPLLIFCAKWLANFYCVHAESPNAKFQKWVRPLLYPIPQIWSPDDALTPKNVLRKSICVHYWRAKYTFISKEWCYSWPKISIDVHHKVSLYLSSRNW